MSELWGKNSVVRNGERKFAMPNKPKRPCRQKSCPRLTDRESGYCEEHEKKAASVYNRFIRRPEAKKRYGYQWQKLRKKFLSINPLCEICKSKGRYTTATEVHHIKPLSEGGTNEVSNLMALCKPCHSAITMTAINAHK